MIPRFWSFKNNLRCVQLTLEQGAGCVWLGAPTSAQSKIRITNSLRGSVEKIVLIPPFPLSPLPSLFLELRVPRGAPRAGRCLWGETSLGSSLTPLNSVVILSKLHN